MEALEHHRLADAGLAHHQAVDVQLVVVLGVGDRRLQRLAHVFGNAPARKLQFVDRGGRRLAADLASHDVELARADTDVAGDGRRLGVRQAAGAGGLAHGATYLETFLSPPPEWPWKTRV